MILDVDTDKDHENEPLLVVFSNDKNKRKSAEKDLKEMLQHESDIGISLSDLDDLYDYEYVDYDYADFNNVIEKRDTIHAQGVLSENGNDTSVQAKLLHRQKKASLYESVSGVDKASEADYSKRVRRAKDKRRRRYRRKRNICRRQSLYVRFEDINWHNWIIAPEGYEVGT